MQKEKITLPTTKWGSLNSKYLPESNHVSNDEFTAGSYGFITNANGSIEKQPTDVQYNSSTLTNPGKDQFEAIFANGTHNLLFLDGGTLKYTTGDGIFLTAATGYTPTASMEYAMYQNRVYFDNGIDNPSVYDLSASYGGVSYSSPTVKTMGAQPPVSAVTFGADTAGGSVPDGGHIYKVTYLYYDLEESNGGPSSTLHTVTGGNQTVNLTAIPIGGYGVTSRNIYRDNNDGNFLLVGEIADNTTTTFADVVSAGTTPIPTSNNLPPVYSYIALNLSRLFVAGVIGTPTALYWSLPGLPDIFDPGNFLICNPQDPITAIAVYQGTTYVFNRHSLGTITGLTDDTFAYQEFPGSVGCVDNRSIRIRTLDGVPTLIWLSDRGFYKCNGSTVEYISDKIEDLVNLNIQQSTFVTGSNTQSSLADFQGGVSSPGIDLLTNPGTITTIDPIVTYQSEADWEAGLSIINMATHDGTNTLKVPIAFAPTLVSGSLSGAAQISGTNVVLPSASNFTGDSCGSDTGPGAAFGPFNRLASSFTIPADGNISLAAISGSNGTGSATFQIWSSVLGQPGTNLGSGFPGPLHLTAGTYWIVELFPGSANGNADAGSHNFIGAINQGMFFNGSTWTVAPYQFFASYTFSQDAVASSGSWASPIYDSFSTSAVADIATIPSSNYPAGTTVVFYVDASNNSTLSSGVTTQSYTNVNGSQVVTTTNLRYWRLRYDLSTVDNRSIPTVGTPNLKFNTTGTWISQPINCTTDVTSYNAPNVTFSVPLGTSGSVTIATSADNITYTSFVPYGSAVIQKWVKVKLTLGASSDDTSTAQISLAQFLWNLTSTFTSSIINVGQVPSGWGVFQDQSALNGGTLAFAMRSAASSGAIPAATFHTVSNGVFPDAAILPLQFTQWNITLMSTPGNLPTISSVTVNWFLGSGQSPIRVASLFFNKTYFLAAAELNQPTNNIVIVYDFENNWRLFRGVNINSLSLFYNQPFYFDAIRKNMYQWLISPTGTGAAIVTDVRTKAFDLGDINKLKVVRSLRVTGLNTGTTIHAYYSVDRGTTWTEMLNVNGTLGYVTSTNGNKFSQYFVASFDPGQETSGNTIMYRATSIDAFPLTLVTLEPVLYVRSGRYLEEPT